MKYYHYILTTLYYYVNITQNSIQFNFLIINEKMKLNLIFYDIYMIIYCIQNINICKENQVKFKLQYLLLTERSEVCRVLRVGLPTCWAQTILSLPNTIPTKSAYL